MTTTAINPESNNLVHDRGDTAVVKGTRVSILATLSTFVVGFFVTVWNVPGVPDAVIAYLSSNLIQVALGFGIPAGIATLLFNFAKKDVKNW